jgi:hypothetical protein
VDGEKLVKTAIDTWGRIDIVVNNAGILRDTTFHKMSKKDFDLVHLVHVHGAKNVTQAAWPHFREQRYGRVVLITSVNGLYGAFGQANYSSAKSAMVGLGKTLAKEGARRNIKVNVVAPGAGSRLTQTVMPERMVELWKAEYVAPMIGLLCHERCPESGQIFEAGGGFFANVKWTRSPGLFLDLDRAFSLEELEAGWSKVMGEDGAHGREGESDHEEWCDPEEDDPMSTPQIRQILSRM